jgi:hypothetical protein
LSGKDSVRLSTWLDRKINLERKARYDGSIAKRR